MLPDYIHPPADPDVARVIEQLRSGLEQLPESWESISDALNQGITPGELRGITSDEYAALYRMAHKLCDEGDFQNALVIGLHLVFHNPRSARYTFLTASCLHRTGQVEQAALMYALTVDLDEHHAAAAYRLGECLAALEKLAEARQFFEKTLDLSRGDLSRRELLLMAESALEKLLLC